MIRRDGQKMAEELQKVEDELAEVAGGSPIPPYDYDRGRKLGQYEVKVGMNVYVLHYHGMGANSTLCEYKIHVTRVYEADMKCGHTSRTIGGPRLDDGVDIDYNIGGFGTWTAYEIK